MDISVRIGNILKTQADAIVLNLFEGVREPGGATGAADRSLGGAIRDLISGGDFTGKFKRTSVLYPRTGVAARRVILVGLGKAADFTLDRARQVAAVAASYAAGLGVKHLATIVHGGGAGGLDLEDAAQAVVEGSVLGTYRFSVYKTGGEEDDPATLERLTVVEFDAARQREVEEGTRAGEIVSEGVTLARDLANHPGNEMTPTVLAERSMEMAEAVGLRCDVLDEEAMEREGMGALLAVARGSDQPPRLIVMEHEGRRSDQQPHVLVGKGITFDTGGISIKRAGGMWEMKFDMCGAAAVIGAMQAIARLDLPVRTIGIAAATENMPGGRALKPGDVIRSMLGKTIEIRNTDAEGRLVLADAVAYSARYKPAALVDLATLTGACVTALGHEASGLMANDDALAERVSRSGERTGEIAWRLPIFEAHREQIKSDVADLKNTGGPAGAIAGGVFIEAFVQGFPWAHLDIAGTAWSDGERPYLSKGGTGYGVRLLVDLLRQTADAVPRTA